MLPEPENSQDESTKKPVVSEDPKTPAEPTKVEAKPEEPQVQEDEPVEPAKENFVPYTELKKERERRKKLQAQLDSLQLSSAPEPENEPLQEDDIRQEIRELKLDKLTNQYPELEDKRIELDEFLEDNSNYSLEDAVDLFRIRRGLVNQSTSEPKGLESPTSGPKDTTTVAGYTPQEVREMREQNFRQYHKLLMEGAFNNVKWD